MRKVTMIFEIKLSVEETKDKIRVRKNSHGKTCDDSPIANFLIVYGFCDDSAGKRMSDRVHVFCMLTCERPFGQIGNIQRVHD